MPRDFDSSVGIELEAIFELNKNSLHPLDLDKYLHKSICNKLDRFPISLGREAKPLPAAKMESVLDD